MKDNQIDAQMEKEIIAKGLTAPRITNDQIDELMESVEYHTYIVPDTTTTVAVAMLDGFTLCQEITACVEPANFDAELGKKYAIEKAASVARNKLWELEGYKLKFNAIPVIAIARTAHEINKAYCLALGDDSQVSWEEAPEWQRQSAVNGVNFHLSNPQAGAEASHNSWLAEKEADGWVYGETKDPETKTHPCFVSFEELPKEQQAKDYLFKATVNALA